jgi:nitroimidazol reductase NimA-like FMN-containing flavoprotein (pyridoxamine 5'-phosphate oxidase superfamily)
MTSSRLRGPLGGLDRLVSAIPGAGGAVGNARRSLEEISRAVHERRVLRHHLDTAAAPGDLAALSPAQCQELLASRSVGRLAYVARAGVPELVPVNYQLVDGAIVLRTGPGPKLQAAERGELVAFEVDDVDESTHTGWSVVVLGRAGRLTAQELGAAAGPQPWAGGPRQHLVRIVPRRTTGRRLLGTEDLP